MTAATTRRVLGIALLVGGLGWLGLWFNTEPRASYDTLIYHTHAFEYAGMSRTEADALSWQVYARYADDREQRIIAESVDGAWSTPDAPRWMGLYEMRPLYATLIAAAYPALGWRAPMAVSAMATILFFVVTLGGFWLLFGPKIALLATVIALFQVDFTRWLVFLKPDGLAMALWAACMAATALIAADGRPRWYVTLGAAVFLLALTRPTGSLVPLIPVVCAVTAAVMRRSIWRRFALAAAAAALPAGLVVLVQHHLGYPGLGDVLQEIATQHFALPDIADPIGYTVTLNIWAITDRLVPTLLTTPALLACVVAGLAGYAVRRSWASAPFLVGALVAPLAWVIHPVWYDAGRTLAPVWVSLNLGIAFTIEWAAVRWRTQLLEVADRFTQPSAGSAAP